MDKFEKIFTLVLGAFVVYLIIEVLRKVFGGSLGFEELTIGLLVANLGYSFKLHHTLSEHIGWHKGKGDV